MKRGIGFPILSLLLILATVPLAWNTALAQTSKFELTPRVRPNPAPFGAAISFAVQVRNVTDQPVTFGHDGCPVRFSVDGRDMPPVACPEYWKQETLAPGASIVFGPDAYPYLNFGADRNAPVVQPGAHVVELDIPDVGSVSARFQVLPAPGGGVIAGHVANVDGTVLAGATIQALPPSWPDSSDTDPAFAPLQAYSSPDGSYRIENVPGGRYIVRAFSSNSMAVWYDQVSTPDAATRIAVTEGQVTGNIDFVLKSAPEPPPYAGWISGSVFEAPAASNAGVPVPGAVVAALMLNAADRDSGGGPADSTIVPPGVPTPLPPDAAPRVFFGFADADGAFRINLPFGRYHIVAFAEGHRYQWFEGAETFDKAVPFIVAINIRAMPANFTLAKLPATAAGHVAGIVKGLPLDSDVASVIFEPLAGAEISARPLVLDPRIATFAEVVYRARSGDDGSYLIEAPPTVPLIVDAQHKGHRGQFFDHAGSMFDARPVDLFAARTTDHVDFDLGVGIVPPPPPPPSRAGVISGFIYYDDGTDGPAPKPLAGAVVRLHSADDLPVPGARITRTDANGHYRFSGLSTASDPPRRYYVSAEADGHIPVYYPHTYQWTTAQPVEPAPPEARVITDLTLFRPFVRSPCFTVGFVRAQREIGIPPTVGDGDASGGGSTDPVPASAGRLIAFATNAVNDEFGPIALPGAYFYLVPAAAAAAGDLTPAAGGVTTRNGTCVVGNLPAGTYRAYADRPGFLVGWYGGTDGAGLITVGEGHEPVLAGILMSLTNPPPVTPGDEARSGVVRDLMNAPNPFRPSTTIMYQLQRPATVSLRVFDVTGRLIRTLVDRAPQLAGQQTVPWDGTDENGVPARAGIYFYRVETPVQALVGKMVLAR